MFYVPKAIKAIFLSALIGTISVQQSHQFPWGFRLKCTSPFLFYSYSPAWDQGKGRVRIQMGGRGRPKDQVGGGSVRHCLAEMGGKGYLEEALAFLRSPPQQSRLQQVCPWFLPWEDLKRGPRNSSTAKRASLIPGTEVSGGQE